MADLILISGGQTGIDRAVLDFCLDKGFSCRGWCPEGRMAEDGIIDSKYPLQELQKGDYSDRTIRNVHDSDATVIIYFSEMKGGTLLSYETVFKLKKPFLKLNMSNDTVEEASVKLSDFISLFKPGTVNFSGPRSSEWPEAYNICSEILKRTF